MQNISFTPGKNRTFWKYWTPSCVDVYISKMVRFLAHPVVVLTVRPIVPVWYIVWTRPCVQLPAVINTRYISADAQLNCQVLLYFVVLLITRVYLRAICAVRSRYPFLGALQKR